MGSDFVNIWNKRDFKHACVGKHNKLGAVIKHLNKCLKWSKQRVTRGYADCDVWEMFNFLQTIIPDMLQTYKNTRNGSPSYLGENHTNEEGIYVNETCHKEWDEILDRMIFLWRECNEDTCSQRNAYEEEHSRASEEFSKKYGLFGEKLQTEEEISRGKERGGHTVHFMSELPEYKEISDLYGAEEERLSEYRNACKDEAFDMLKQFFYSLWD